MLRCTFKAALASAALSFLAACSTLPRQSSVELLATTLPINGFQLADQGESAQRLLARLRSTPAGETLTIYIEGDGAAWSGAYRPPDDPTPDDAVVLGMTLADPAANVAYLARPCQYLSATALSNCDRAQWTVGRFAPEVVLRMEAAVDALKRRANAKSLHLVGYSGGGTIAALLAARRSDVTRLITVAAPLRVQAWTTHHRVTPLTASLDPDTLTSLPATLQAVHFFGAEDKVTPRVVMEPWIARLGGRVVEVPRFDHSCCWSRDWRALLEGIR